MVRAGGLGFLAAAVDCRYHGERAAPGAVTPYEGYQDALVRYTPVPPAALHLAGICKCSKTDSNVLACTPSPGSSLLQHALVLAVHVLLHLQVRLAQHQPRAFARAGHGAAAASIPSC